MNPWRGVLVGRNSPLRDTMPVVLVLPKSSRDPFKEGAVPQNEQPRSEKHNQARNSLSEELRPVFDAFVDDYRFSSIKHYGAPFISYAVLADMVKAGWRPVARPGFSQSE